MSIFTEISISSNLQQQVILSQIQQIKQHKKQVMINKLNIKETHMIKVIQLERQFIEITENINKISFYIKKYRQEISQYQLKMNQIKKIKFIIKYKS